MATNAVVETDLLAVHYCKRCAQHYSCSMRAGLREISQLTVDQWGLITSRQAASLGVSRVQLSRMASRGLLQRLAHGVYFSSSTPDDQATMLRAVWLSLDPARTALERIAVPHEAGVVSHESAAFLHQMGDLQEHRHHLTFPGRKQTRRDDVMLHQSSLERDDVVLVDGLPCTTPERTIADLRGAGHELGHLAQALTDGMEHGKVDFSSLLGALERTQRSSGPAGAATARRQLDELRQAAGVDAVSLVERAAGSALGENIAAKWLENAGLQGLKRLPDLSALKMTPVIDPALMQQILGLGSQTRRITDQVSPRKGRSDQHTASTASDLPNVNEDETAWPRPRTGSNCREHLSHHQRGKEPTAGQHRTSLPWA